MDLDPRKATKLENLTTKNLNLNLNLKHCFFSILILHLVRSFVKSEIFFLFGVGQWLKHTPHDAESIWKTLKIFNLTTTNAIMGNLTTIMHLHTS